MNNKIIYVLHEHGEPSHYLALEKLAEQNNCIVKYYEFLLYRQFKSCLKRPFKVFRLIRNIWFLVSLPYRKPIKVVVGIAPFNSLLPRLRDMLSKHETYFHTSYFCWDGTSYFHRPASWEVVAVWKKWVSSEIKHVFSVSEATKKQLVDHNYAIPSRVTVVYHSYNEKLLPVNHFIKTNTFLYVGRLEEAKGISELLAYFEKNSDLSLTIVGDGPNRDEVLRYSLKNSNIHYVGYVKSLKEIMFYYQTNSFLVLNSHKNKSWEELFGMVLPEGMACGCVPIATDHSGPKEVITNEIDGFLCPEGQICDYINSAAQMSNEKYQSMRECAIRRGMNFSSDIVAQRWSILFEKN